MIQEFGTTSDGQKVVRITLEDGCGNTASFISLGAAIQSLVIDGCDTVLGYDSAYGYESNTGCLGAVMGRCANRIKNASFRLGGKTVELSKNRGTYHIHGGFRGFDKRIWDSYEEANTAVFKLKSEDGEEGYPGNLTATVRYTFKDRVLRIEYDAVSDKDTVISLTNHSYFNLDGFGEILRHTLTVDSNRIAAIDSEGIPCGGTIDVKNTAFDFSDPKVIEWGISDYHPLLQQCRGYDHSYIISGNSGEFRHVATLTGSKGLSMDVFSDMDSICLYTGNWLSGQKGKNGKSYMPYSGICFEAQYVTNAVNLDCFRQPVFKAGEHFTQNTEFRFR